MVKFVPLIKIIPVYAVAHRIKVAGTDKESAALSTAQICLQEFNMREHNFLCLLQMYGIRKLVEHHNQTPTN